MQQLWTGEEVTFEGELWQVLEARMAITPVQKPHPPIWIAARSAGAAHRAANVRDACLIGHQPIWEDFRFLAGKYRQALVEVGKGSRGLLAANRSMAIAKDRETAVSQAKLAGEAKAGMYSSFNMQEATTVGLGLGGSRDLFPPTVRRTSEVLAASNDRTSLSELGCSRRPVANVFLGSFSPKVPELEDEGSSYHL